MANSIKPDATSSFKTNHFDQKPRNGGTPAIVAVFFSIIGVYYYLRIIKLMYFDQPDTMSAIKASQQMRAVLTINGLLILLIGLAPNSLMRLCIAAFSG